MMISTSTLFASVAHHARAFRHDTSGVVAVIVGLAAVPMIGLTGASLDYSRAQDVRSAYQDAADAAALAAATSTHPDFESRQAYARATFDANIPDGGHAIRSFALVDHELGYEVRATGSVETTLLGIIGIDDIDVGVNAIAAAGSQPLEISFVIDATRSMTFGSRWRTAYDSLDAVLTALDDSIDRRDDFTVTVVPMGDRVNVGTHRFEWVEGFAEDQGNNRGRGGHWNDEERERAGDQGRRGWRDETGAGEALPMAEWQGCVQPREEDDGDNPYLLTDATPAELAFEPFDHRGPSGTHTDRQYECPLSIIGPSNDVYYVMRELDGIEGAGTGRFDEGLAWGWRTVSSNWSGEWGISDYPTMGDEARKVVVFISDGNSTMEDHEFDGHSEWGYNNSGAAMFDNFATVCDDMKDQGITIYTFYIEGNPYADEYMMACASSPAHYFDVTRNEDMTAAFDAIGTSLMEARLVR